GFNTDRNTVGIIGRPASLTTLTRVPSNASADQGGYAASTQVNLRAQAQGRVSLDIRPVINVGTDMVGNNSLDSSKVAVTIQLPRRCFYNLNAEGAEHFGKERRITSPFRIRLHCISFLLSVNG